MSTRIVPSRCLFCKEKAPTLPGQPSSSRVRDLTGQTFGRLTVQHFVCSANGNAVWCCLCACGTPSLVRAPALRQGVTQSCGCLQQERRPTSHRTHGLTRTTLYTRWCHMIARCTNPNNPAFANYGGRGITVCARWRDSFEAFAADMGQPPIGCTLERRDNNAGYEPANCYWASITQQANNKRSNRFITFTGETNTLAVWAQQLPISYTTLLHRLNAGWPIEKAFTTPVRPLHKQREAHD